MIAHRLSITVREICILVGQRGRAMGRALDRTHCLHQEQGLGAFPGKFFDSLLQLRNDSFGA